MRFLYNKKRMVLKYSLVNAVKQIFQVCEAHEPKKVGIQQSDNERVYKWAERLGVTFFGKGAAAE